MYSYSKAAVHQELINQKSPISAAVNTTPGVMPAILTAVERFLNSLTVTASK